MSGPAALRMTRCNCTSGPRQRRRPAGGEASPTVGVPRRPARMCPSPSACNGGTRSSRNVTPAHDSGSPPAILFRTFSPFLTYLAASVPSSRLHAVEQYCTNQLRLAVSSGDPLRVREVQGALSQMRVAPLPLEVRTRSMKVRQFFESSNVLLAPTCQPRPSPRHALPSPTNSQVRSPLPTAPVVQQAPRTVRAAVMHPAPPSAHRHMPPAGTWPGLCVKAGRPDSDDATDIPPPTSAPRLTLFSPLSSHAPLRSSGRQQRAGRAPPARVPARAGRTSARVPARAADAPPAAAPARHAGATARGPGPRLGLVDVELRERLGERRLGLRSRRRAPHRHPHRCRRGGSDGRGGHEPDLDHEPGGVRVPCSRSVTFHAVQLRQAEGVNLLALFRLRQSPRTFPTLFEPLNQLPCPPGSSQQLLNADLFPTYSHDCLPSDPRPYSRVFSFL